MSNRAATQSSDEQLPSEAPSLFSIDPSEAPSVVRRVAMSSCAPDEDVDELLRTAPAWMRYMPKPSAAPVPPVGLSVCSGIPSRPATRALRQSVTSPPGSSIELGPPAPAHRKYRVRSNLFAPDLLPAISLPSVGGKRKRGDSRDDLDVTQHGEGGGGPVRSRTCQGRGPPPDRAQSSENLNGVVEAGAMCPQQGREEEDDPAEYRRRRQRLQQTNHIGEMAALMSFTRLTKHE